MISDRKITVVSGVSQNTHGRIELLQAINEIKKPDTKDLKIIQARRNGEEADKTKLRSYVFGALFKNDRRRKQDLLSGTGIAILDYDGLEKYDIDPHVFKQRMFNYYTFIIAAFISPSGVGVKFLINIPVVDNANDYTSYYNALFKDLCRHPGLDPSGKDITRLCFTSHDTNVLFRDNPILWDYMDELPHQKANAQTVEIINPTEDRMHIKNIMAKSFKEIVEHPMHPKVMKLATAMGGYVKAGYYNEVEAIEMLDGLIDCNNAMDKKDTRKQNIVDGIKYGIVLGALYVGNSDSPLKSPTSNNPLLKLINERHFNHESIFEAEVPIIFFGGKKAMSLGNFSVITGKQKVGKNFTESMIVDGFLNGDAIKDVIGSNIKTRKKVVYIDTEQAGGHAKRLIDTVKKLGGNEDLIDGYWLRGFAPKDIIEAVEIIIKKHSKDACLFIIDGIRDLSSKGVNDQEESAMIFVKLLDWTQSLNIHIIVVIHQNKADGNATGYLGGDMVKKGELTLAVEKDKQAMIHKIIPEDTRDAPLETIHFIIDDTITPVIIDSPRGSKRKKDPEDYEFTTHKTTLSNIFKNGKALTSSELLDKIKYHFNIGDSKAKRFKEYWLDKHLIKDEGHSGKRQYILYEDIELF